MARSKGDTEPAAQTNEWLRKLASVQLGLAGIPQAKIRKIVGGSINEINATVKLLKPGRRGGE